MNMPNLISMKEQAFAPVAMQQEQQQQTWQQLAGLARMQRAQEMQSLSNVLEMYHKAAPELQAQIRASIIANPKASKLLQMHPLGMDALQPMALTAAGTMKQKADLESSDDAGRLALASLLNQVKAKYGAVTSAEGKGLFTEGLRQEDEAAKTKAATERSIAMSTENQTFMDWKREQGQEDIRAKGEAETQVELDNFGAKQASGFFAQSGDAKAMADVAYQAKMRQAGFDPDTLRAQAAQTEIETQKKQAQAKLDFEEQNAARLNALEKERQLSTKVLGFEDADGKQHFGTFADAEKNGWTLVSGGSGTSWRDNLPLLESSVKRRLDSYRAMQSDPIQRALMASDPSLGIAKRAEALEPIMKDYERLVKYNETADKPREAAIMTMVNRYVSDPSYRNTEKGKALPEALKAEGHLLADVVELFGDTNALPEKEKEGILSRIQEWFTSLEQPKGDKK